MPIPAKANKQKIEMELVEEIFGERMSDSVI